MSIAPFRSALLCTCISLSAATVPAVDSAPSALELELGLARHPQLYLIVNIDEPSLEVKARGLVLDRTLLQTVTIASLQPIIGRHRWPEFEPPFVWRVAEPPAAEWRQLVAPTELRPYSDKDAAAPQPTRPPPAPEAPSHYALMADSGWQLMIRGDAGDGLWQGLADAVASSWRRWTGQPPQPAVPRLVLTMAPDDARRLLHVFQDDLAILVVASPIREPSGGGGR